MKIVLALGGNALQSDPKDKTPESQLKTCKDTAKSIVDLIAEGHTVSIVHGNGPQVGQILASVEAGHKANDTNVLFPFDVCGAFSQGYIGYHLQNAIEEELNKRNINKPVGTVVTQVLVNADDQGFKNPTKPIGSFYSEEEAKKLEAEKGYVMKEDAGRGYRRVVASPKPVDVIEKAMIKQLVEAGNIVISCGGGGIPVVNENGIIKGVPAVIDKDFAAEKLAEIIDADMLLILTAVDQVAINFNKPNQESLSQMNLEEVDKYISEGQFAPGSMLPKVEACKKFVEFNENKIAIIGSLEKAKDAINGTSGTRIVR
ncbi:carbamate kinase [Clostridium tepidum]|jgi:carbamate kinase|uniref:Carbamate kinase n=1 Tax=Clostridium tepidum TaxID=1962263 RepID=A0A1S9IHA1_9CLOT|nr:carbamate kinase [Clostridium tepidum]MCR1933594.1 carbamate kinase [Clostridium tepidum]MDU6876893.1 carbamate kinase [Clostridium botulinum]OOO63528.1 carbamate kinase [Clostridium tepidum]OOO69677.1 carbamate kinase [Clostridium tepidum]